MNANAWKRARYTVGFALAALMPVCGASLCAHAQDSQYYQQPDQPQQPYQQAPQQAPVDGQAQQQAPAAPPPPPAQTPPPPTAQAQQYYAQPAPQGQWVYTAANGWIWVPVGANASYVVGGVPYVYMYAPTYGWTWYASPWGYGRFAYGPWVRGAWPYGYRAWVRYPGGWGWHVGPGVSVRIGGWGGYGHGGYYRGGWGGGWGHHGGGWGGGGWGHHGGGGGWGHHGGGGHHR